MTVITLLLTPPGDNRVVTDSHRGVWNCHPSSSFSVSALLTQIHLRYVPFSKYSSLYYPLVLQYILLGRIHLWRISQSCSGCREILTTQCQILLIGVWYYEIHKTAFKDLYCCIIIDYINCWASSFPAPHCRHSFTWQPLWDLTNEENTYYSETYRLLHNLSKWALCK